MRFILVNIILAAFFLRQTRMNDFPFFGDELQNGDIALEILNGHIAPFYAQGFGREALYDYSMALMVAVLGDNVWANRWPSVMWSIVLVPMMYVYAVRLFSSKRLGVIAAAIAAGLWWTSVFAHSGLRVVTMPVIMLPALWSLAEIGRKTQRQRQGHKAIIGGFFAGLTAYTYISGRGFPVIVVLFIGYLILSNRRHIHHNWRAYAIYLVVMAVTSMALYLSIPAATIRCPPGDCTARPQSFV